MKSSEVALISVFMLWLAGTANAQQQTTHGAQSPAVNHMENSVINYHSASPISPKPNSLDAKREALLMAENPTVLEIRELKWGTWFGDSVPYLGVQLVNTSKLPALSVRLDILNNLTGGTIAKLKPHTLSKSYTLKIVDGSPIDIAGGGAWVWPIASVIDLQKILKSDCLTDAGLDFDSSNLALPKDTGEFQSGRGSKHQSGLYFRLSYKTIFGEKVSYSKMGVIDSTTRSEANSIQRGTGRLVPLKCVGDPM